VIAYYLLTGKKPFLNGVTDLDLINNILHDKPREINDIQIPSKLKNVIMRCLAKKLEGRPNSLLELIEALEQFNHESWNQNLAKEWWQKNLTNLLDINE
jgi:serine/threonine protein kinase